MLAANKMYCFMPDQIIIMTEVKKKGDNSLTTTGYTSSCKSPCVF